MAIATGTALMAGASAVGGLAQASAAGKAADAQTSAADQQIALQREVYEDQTQRFSPFLEGGTNALGAYLYELGLGDAPMVGGSPAQIEEFTDQVPGQSGQYQFRPADRGQQGGYYDAFGNFVGATDPTAATEQTRFRVGDQVFSDRESAEQFAAQTPTGGTQYQGIDMSPGARFALEQGRDTMESGASARGSLYSGATLSGLEELRMGMAAQDRENQLNRLAGLTDMGQGAAGMQASAGNAFANMASTSLANMGNAQAAGAIGQGNAFSGMMNNLSGIYGYQQMMNQPQTMQPNALAPTSSLRPQARPF